MGTDTCQGACARSGDSRCQRTCTPITSSHGKVFLVWPQDDLQQTFPSSSLPPRRRAGPAGRGLAAGAERTWGRAGRARPAPRSLCLGHLPRENPAREPLVHNRGLHSADLTREVTRAGHARQAACPLAEDGRRCAKAQSEPFLTHVETSVGSGRPCSLQQGTEMTQTVVVATIT